VDVLVSRNLRKLRHEHDLTLSEIGSELGIGSQQVHKYETGRNRLSAGMLCILADLFGVPIQEFFEDELDGRDTGEGDLLKARNRCHALIARMDCTERLVSISGVLEAMSRRGG